MKTKPKFRNKARRFIFFTTIFTALFIPTTGIFAQSPVYTYAKKMGGTSVEVGNCITPDFTGGQYTVGFFKGTCDFDPGTGTQNLISSGGSADIFISKLNYSGNYEWAKRIGGTLDDQALSIGRDLYGNIYVTGYFSGTVDFDPNGGITNLISNGGTDIFIAKFDYLGNFKWAYNFGGTGNDQGTGLTIDYGSQIYITGIFSGTNIDFEPGAGVTALTSAGGSNDIFVLKLDTYFEDPNNTNPHNHFGWVRKFGGTSNDKANSIKINNHLDLFFTGFFAGINVDFDPLTTNEPLLTSVGLNDVFISRLNCGDGGLFWVKQVGGTLNDTAFSITSDLDGNVYTSGNFSGSSVDFDPGVGAVNKNSIGGTDIFILKLTINGNFIWAKTIGGTTADGVRSILIDANSYLYTTGFFSGTNVDFDPGTGVANLTSAGNSDIFISKLDTAGNYIWAGKIGSTTSDVGASIVIDGGNNLFLTGSFTGTVDFDAGVGTSNLIASGACDIFVTKYNQTPTQLTGPNCSPPTPTEYRPNNAPFTIVNNPLKKTGYQLVFHDEFDSPGILADIPVDNYTNPSSIWIEQSQTTGNGILYCKANSEGDPNKPSYSFQAPSTNDYPSNRALQININSENLGGEPYTSGWLESIRGFKHGYFEIRAKLPTQRATWSTWWLSAGVDEIDNYETINQGNPDYHVYYNYHYLNHGYPIEPTAFWGPAGPTQNIAGGSNQYDPSWLYPGTIPNPSLAFHTYGLKWEPGQLDFYIDNKLTNSIKNDCNVSESVMHLITAMNIDGSYNPTPSDFPGQYLIDYIRVYKRIWVENFGTVMGWTYEGPRMMADMDGSGYDDIVGFGGAGVYVSLATDNGGIVSYTAPSLWTANYGYNDGWTVEAYVRTTADVTGDGRDDVVAFGGAGVFVSISNGASLTAPTLWVTNYGYDAGAGGWRVDFHPRMMADVNGDGKADVVGFGGAGIFVSLSNGYSFSAPVLWTANYGYDAGAGGWRVDTDVRQMADLNGDGKADVVGFNASGTWVALSNGTSFATPVNGAPYFANSTDVNISETPRMMADVNGDGKSDIVGFLKDGVHVSLSRCTTNVQFDNQARWINNFGLNQQAGTWLVTDHPRMMADLNGDGMEDIVGFKDIGVYVSFSTSTGFTDLTQWTDFYGSAVNGGTFTILNNPRMTADVNGDCRKDIVAFGDSGVFVTLSPKCAPFLFRLANYDNNTVSQSDEQVKNLVSQSELNIFPNPGSGLFTVSLPNGNLKSISVFDLTGRIIFETESSDNEINIDISSESKGMYVVKCIVNGEIKVVKYLNQ